MRRSRYAELQQMLDEVRARQDEVIELLDRAEQAAQRVVEATRALNSETN